MTRQLHVADGFSFPLDLVVYQTAILARTGAGKTNTATVIAEEVLAAGEQCVILDPPGAWWGLRSSADGQSPGFPIIVLGGDHADLPLEPTAGKVIADFVVDERQSVILDLSEFSGGETVTFVTAFAERLYQRKGSQRSPMLLIVEESDELAPQKPQPGEQRMLGAMERVAKRGRMRGIGFLAITQRSASLNKNVLSQIETLIAMQTTDPRDIDAIDDWVKRTGDQERRRQLLAEIAELPIGTAFIWSPAWLRIFQRVAFRKRRTFDSSATPKPGQVRSTPKQRAEVDLEDLRQRIAQTIERERANDPKLLREEIARLKAELKKRPTETRVETVIQRVEVPVVTEEMLAKLSTLAVQVNGSIVPFIGAVEELTNALADATPTVHRGPGVAAHIRSEPEPQPPPPVPIRPPVARNEAPTVPMRDRDSEDRLPIGAMKMLTVLAQRHPMRFTRSQLGTLSGYIASGGTFRTYLSLLRKAGMIEEVGRELAASSAGLALVGDIANAPQSDEELREMWMKVLPGGAATMLQELISLFPQWINRHDLGEHTGYVSSGGTFRTYLSMLNRNGLIEKSGQQVRASSTLFLDEGARE